MLLQVSVEELPLVIVVGLALNEAVAADPTVTVAEAIAPLQFTEYVVVEVGLTEAVPLVAPPVEKPVPVQLVVWVLLQVRLDEPPLLTLLGVAVSVALALATVTVTVCEAVAPPQFTA